jgi:hypothetical protein
MMTLAKKERKHLSRAPKARRVSFALSRRAFPSRVLVALLVLDSACMYAWP